MRIPAFGVALAASASIACAQRNAVITMVRLSGDSVWHERLDYRTPWGSTTHSPIEVGIFYERASGYGFARAIHSVEVSNWHPERGDYATLLDRPDSALHPDGRQGRFNFGAQAQQAYTGGVDIGRLRVGPTGDPDDNAGFGIDIRQDSPVHAGSAFDTSNLVLGFRLDIALAFPGDDQVHTYITGPHGFGAFLIFDTPQSTTATYIDPNTVVVRGALITTQWQTPAPSSALAVGATCAGFGLRRRRKRLAEEVSPVV